MCYEQSKGVEKKTLDVTEVNVKCPGKVLNEKENHGRGSGLDHQDYGGECCIILMG